MKALKYNSKKFGVRANLTLWYVQASEAELRKSKLTSVFRYLPKVCPKQLCALAHPGSTNSLKNLNSDPEKPTQKTQQTKVKVSFAQLASFKVCTALQGYFFFFLSSFIKCIYRKRKRHSQYFLHVQWVNQSKTCIFRLVKTYGPFSKQCSALFYIEKCLVSD